MSLTPAQRARQARVKWNIIIRREIRRELGAGIICGNYDNRMLLDTIERTFEAGRRAGLAEAGKGQGHDRATA